MEFRLFVTGRGCSLDDVVPADVSAVGTTARPRAISDVCAAAITSATDQPAPVMAHSSDRRSMNMFCFTLPHREEWEVLQ